MIAHKENMSNEESNALINLRGYHSDEDEKPTGHPKVNPIVLQYFFAFSTHSPYLYTI